MEEKEPKPENDLFEQAEFNHDGVTFFSKYNYPNNPRIQKLMLKEVADKITKEEQEELDAFLDAEDEKLREKIKRDNLKED